MKAVTPSRPLFPRQLLFILLASAVAVPTLAHGQSAPASQNTPPAAVQQQPPSATSSYGPKEGFWGRINPFARKKWVDRRVNPLKDQMTELDEVNAKNGRDIQDVDQRAQAGIRRAQSSADAANQTAMDAGNRAQKADATAQGASATVDQLNSTVSGLDQYRQTSAIQVEFRGGQPVLSAAARKQLDDLAASLAGQDGYILEIEGHSPLAGGAGIQRSERLTEAVKRYLFEQHEIPVYRMHSVALGNAVASGNAEARPARAGSSVQVRLMVNSLAAQDVAPPHDAASSTGAERP